MNYTISFNKHGYDPFIDFIKAYAIICVLIGHTVPHLSKIGYAFIGGMQVPLFILIQSFHVLKKKSPKFDISNVTKRVLIPFAITTFITILIIAGMCKLGGNSLDITSVIKKGGIGPGSYYPWIFLQLAIIIPLLRPLLEKGNRFKQIIVAILICELFEIFESIIGIPEYLHRLIAIRYFFLIFLAWIWVKDGIVLNIKTLVLSLISLFAIIYFEYFSNNDEPWFFNTTWKYHRWPCYFYVSTFFCFILYFVYTRVSKIRYINRFTRTIAKCSYEIFLLQMALITIIPYFGIAWIILIIGSSIVGGYFFNRFYAVVTYHRQPGLQ